MSKAGECPGGADVPEGGFRLGGGVCATGVPAVLTLMLAKRADRGFCSSPGKQSLRQNWLFPVVRMSFPSKNHAILLCTTSTLFS